LHLVTGYKLFFVASAISFGQQVQDSTYHTPIPNPAYRDGGHYNFHKAAGRFLAFVELLRGMDMPP